MLRTNARIVAWLAANAWKMHGAMLHLHSSLGATATSICGIASGIAEQERHSSWLTCSTSHSDPGTADSCAGNSYRRSRVSRFLKWAATYRGVTTPTQPRWNSPKLKPRRNSGIPRSAGRRGASRVGRPESVRRTVSVRGGGRGYRTPRSGHVDRGTPIAERARASGPRSPARTELTGCDGQRLRTPPARVLRERTNLGRGDRSGPSSSGTVQLGMKAGRPASQGLDLRAVSLARRPSFGHPRKRPSSGRSERRARPAGSSWRTASGARSRFRSRTF